MALSRLRWTLVPAALFFTACTDLGGPDPAPSKLEALPRQLTAAEQKLIAGNNQFAFELFRTLNADQHTKNVFVSPVSASMALGMTMNGANGATFDAMRHALRLDNATREEVNEGYKSLISLLRGLDKTTDFRIANSIWYEQTFPFSSSFLSESQSFFDASVKPLDFRNTAASVNQVNGWVNTATNKKIPQILDTIDPNEVMFLINAIYFKGSWVDKFDKSRTADATFHSIDGQSTTPMMNREGPVTVGGTQNYTVVDMPYGNSAFSMTVVMPSEGIDINMFAESLTQPVWQSLTGSLGTHEGILYFPKFKLEWQRLLNDDLSALGMGVAFTDQADFSKMSPDRAVEISNVLQKTFVDVNEEGTEAAAATSVGVTVTSAPSAIRIDRPFVFAIRERLSGTILFMGKIVKLPIQS